LPEIIILQRMFGAGPREEGGCTDASSDAMFTQKYNAPATGLAG
jgi:hypothetical protein